MCVLNRRADVAKICLGKMGLFRGARALRAVDQDNPDTKIAVLAVHLNMKVCRVEIDELKLSFVSHRRKKLKRFYSNRNNTIFSINCINPRMSGKKRLMSPHVMTVYTYEIRITISPNLSSKVINWKEPLNCKEENS